MSKKDKKSKKSKAPRREARVRDGSVHKPTSQYWFIYTEHPNTVRMLSSTLTEERVERDIKTDIGIFTTLLPCTLQELNFLRQMSGVSFLCFRQIGNDEPKFQFSRGPNPPMPV